MDFWGIAGKIGAALGAIWSVVQIYRHFVQKKHDVRFSVTKLEKALPPLRNRVDAWLDKSKSRHMNVERQSIDEVIASLKDGATYGLLSDMPTTVVRIGLENKGKKAAKRIVVDLGSKPSDFVFSSDEVKIDGDVLRLDELRPGQSITATVWFESYYYQSVAVSHEDHVVEQPFSITSTGLVARFVEFFLTPPQAYFFLPAFVLLGVTIYQAFRLAG